jgi:hypothetical protein
MNVAAFEMLARALEAALIEHQGNLKNTCTTANNVIFRLFPGAERHVGFFLHQPHEWVRLEGFFVDAGVGQFTQAGPVVAAALDARWQGRLMPWQPTDTWPAGKLEEVQILAGRVRKVLRSDPG